MTSSGRSAEFRDSPTGLGIRAADIGGGVEFALSGELDLSQAGALKQEIARVLDSLRHGGDTPARVVLDLQRLTFIDSSGIQVLVAAKRRCIDHGIQLVLRIGDSQVRRMLSLAGVGEFLGID